VNVASGFHLASPESAFDWLRIGNALLGAILAGMAAEILYRYRRERGAAASHVVLVAASYLLVVAASVFRSLTLVGAEVEPTASAIVVPVLTSGYLLGIVALYRMLRVLSGKSDRSGS